MLYESLDPTPIQIHGLAIAIHPRTVLRLSMHKLVGPNVMSTRPPLNGMLNAEHGLTNLGMCYYILFPFVRRKVLAIFAALAVLSHVVILSQVETQITPIDPLPDVKPPRLPPTSTRASTTSSVSEPSIQVLYDQMKDPKYLDFENGRSLRFPSVNERIKFYLSSWYLPPCPNNPEGFIQYNYPQNSESTLELRYFDQVTHHKNGSIMLDTAIDTDRLFHVRSNALLNCTLENEIETLKRIYCPELFKFLMPYRSSQFDEINGTIPLIAQVGDAPLSKNYFHVNLPHFKKTRLHIEKNALDNITNGTCQRGPRMKINNLIQPILWKIKFKRHFPRLHKIPKEDRPWGSKKNSAIFRGTFTGPNIDNVKSPDERCRLVPRCSMVRNSVNSSIIDAKFVRLENRVPEVVGGVTLKTKLTFRPEQLQHKGLIMPEGNDVSSGLKWALLSNSVVLAGPPTATSWAMEALLVPWVHYVPVRQDLTDVEEKMQWIIEHDEEAQYIAKRGSLWIKDLLFHSQSEPDNDAINREVLRRYAAHFRPR